MTIKRRKFLQGIGGLTILGASQFAWCDQLDRFSQALAQNTGRKLALLIGINSYADQPLRGCLTDVQLIKELLIHRFGFATGNIISLTEQQATRENILNTWQSLFRISIQPNDLILLHFSGYGQRLSLSLPNSNLPTNLHGLIPVDRMNTSSLHTSVLPIFTSDLYKELPTSNIISVLDTSYDYPETVRNWRSRSRPGIKTEMLDPTIADLYGNPASGQINPMPAIILAACQKHQIAMEIDYSGFSAGLFTYSLTQTLWESLPATKILINFNRVSNRVIKLANPDQQPQLQINDSLVNLIPINAPAPAVITAIEDNGKTARLWLGGILPENLEYISINSVFIPDLSNTAPFIQLTIKNRQGLTAKAHINYAPTDTEVQTLQPGTILREIVRIFPKSLQLKVALDESLAKIEKVDATSNFSAIPQIAVVNGATSADYIFGRQPQDQINPAKELTGTQLYQGKYALFSRHANLLTNTCATGSETVKTAIQRLTPYLQNLLAVKTLRLTQNKLSTTLPVRATLATIAPQAQVIMQEATRSAKPDQSYTPSFTVPIKTRMRTNIYNESDRPLYYTLFLLDTAGRLLILSPKETELSLLAAGANTIIPQPNTSDLDPENVGWKMSGPAGFSEIYLVLTEKPCENMITALTGNTKNVREYPGLQELTNPLKVIKALLSDLQNNQSSQSPQKLSVSPDDLALNLQNWVTLNFSYQVL